MAYDERVAERIRNVLAPVAGAAERKMMGGLCFLVGGHMCCGIDGERLFVRMDRDAVPAALRRKHAEAWEVGGRTMGGFVAIRPAGFRDARALRSWVEPAAAWAASLPAKKAPKKKKQPMKKKSTPSAEA